MLATRYSNMRQRCKREGVRSVSEQALSREDHGHAMLVRGPDDFYVAHRAAVLNDGPHARLGGGVHAISERKERIRSQDRAFELKAGIRRFLYRDA